jgi:hypothetical protein
VIRITDKGIEQESHGEGVSIPWASVRSLRYERPRHFLTRCLCIEVVESSGSPVAQLPRWSQKKQPNLFRIPTPSRSQAPIAEGSTLLGVCFRKLNPGTREALKYIRSHPPAGVAMVHIAQAADGSDAAGDSEGREE